MMVIWAFIELIYHLIRMYQIFARRVVQKLDAQVEFGMP